MSLATNPATETVHLRTLLATYPHTVPLHNGELTSPRVALDFQDVTPTSTPGEIVAPVYPV